MKSKPTYKERIINNFISEDGELLDSSEDIKTHKLVFNSKESFSFMYAFFLGLLDDLDNTTIKVLSWCSINCTYNSNIVNLTKPMCEKITSLYGIQYQTIKNSITKLKKKNILIALGSGTYCINPRYVWRGESKERLKTMKYILEMECSEC